MKRRLLNILTILSALLCVAVVALWVRSYFASDTIQHASVTMTTSGFRWWSRGVNTCKGVVSAGIIRSDYAEVLTPQPNADAYQASLAELRGYSLRTREQPWLSRPAADWRMQGDHPLNRWGFIWQSPDLNTPTHRMVGVSASAPYWFLLLILSLPLAPRLVRRLRPRPRGATLCPSCGYDLRATPARCPECGAAAEALRDSQ